MRPLVGLALTSALSPSVVGAGTTRTTFGVIVGVVGGVATVATAAGFLGRWWWGFDLLANFRPQLFLLLAPVAAASALVGGRWSVMIFVAAALVNGALVLPLIVASKPAVDAAGPRLDLVSFNVQASNRERREVMEYLRATDPDVAFMIESSFEWERAAERAQLDHVIAARVPDDLVFGITLLIRPEIPVRVRQLRLGDRPAVEVVLPFGDEELAVLAIHPVSPVSGSRAARRDAHLAGAATWARDRSGHVVVIGDFNASPWSHAFRRLVRESGLENSLKGHGLQPTFPVGWGPLMIPIDHALVSPSLATAERRTGPPAGSDHRPVELTVGRRR